MTIPTGVQVARRPRHNRVVSRAFSGRKSKLSTAWFRVPAERLALGIRGTELAAGFCRRGLGAATGRLPAQVIIRNPCVIVESGGS